MTSFDPTSGKLTISLNDGATTETGSVTRDTEITCEAMDNHVGDDLRSDGGPGPSGADGPGDQNGNHGDRGDDNGNGDMENENSSTAELMNGTVVLGAELRISRAGTFWHEIELMP